MSTEIVMPRLSDTMDTGTVAKWLKREGEQVQRGEVIAEIETDKANMDMESYADGILAQILVPEGQAAALGEAIAVVAANQEEADSLRRSKSDGSKPEDKAVDQPPPAQGPPVEPQTGQAEPSERVKASPLARRMAQEEGLDLRRIKGGGPGGRITKEDVQSFMKQAPAHLAPSRPEHVETEVRRVQAPGHPTAPGRAPDRIEMSRMQQTIARRLTEARFGAPDFLLTSEYDMTEARALLESIAATEGAPNIGPNDLLIKSVAIALTKHPEANAGWEEGIVHYRNVNVGFAVAISGGGLVVPVVRSADRKSLGEIATEAKSLRDKAREGKLAPAEYEDGTFTISNLGMYGIDQFTAILNPPEACSLAVGAITRKPVVSGEEMEIRDRMRVTLTCDHRVINGAQGAEFLQTLRRYLEHPALALI